MTEISKMFENAGIKPLCQLPDEYCGMKNIYEDFTAEKQLAIFKMFCRKYLEVSQHVEENGDLCFGIKTTVSDYIVAFNKDFAECLACFVNNFWLSLTNQEKEEIRNILNA